MGCDRFFKVEFLAVAGRDLLGDLAALKMLLNSLCHILERFIGYFLLDHNTCLNEK